MMNNVEIIEDINQTNNGKELSFANDHLIWMADQAEKRVEAINRIMTTAIKMTTIKDWVGIGGNPYLMETGASKIARLFGISWQINSPVKEYDKEGDGHYVYRASGTFVFAGAEITAEGLRSTHDEFFIGSATDKDGTAKAQKKPRDIDERDVMQAAYTNCLNNGIKRVLPGLRNISVETLQAAGLDVANMKGYGFNNGTPKEMTGEAKDQKAEIERMLREVYGDKWTLALEKETAFTTPDGREIPGKKDINKLSEKQIPIIYGRVKQKYEAWVKEHGEQTNNGETTSGGEGEDSQLPV